MNGKTILLVEDDRVLSDALGAKFTDSGFTVVVAETAEEGIIQAHEHAPDIIVTDITLPGMNGMQMVEQIRATPQGAKIPVILLTNNDDTETVAQALDTGLTTYLLKSDHGITSIIDTVIKQLTPSEPTA